MVSHDGDVPVHMKSWDGNAADCTIFRERSTELLKQFELGQMKCLVADSKFYTKENSKNWHLIQYITRIPERINEAKAYIKKAVELNVWESHSNKNIFYRKFDVSHYNTKQRWIVCYSNESYQRVVKTIDKKVQREADAIKKQLKKLCSQKFSCSKDAKKIATDMTKKWNFHAPDQIEVKPKEKIYQIEVQYRVLKEVVEKEKHEKSCFILGSNLLPTDYTDEEVITGYKNQQAVERGYRFLKDPYFFAQGFFLKKPERISALIMVMTFKKADFTLGVAFIARGSVHCVSQKIGDEMQYSLQGVSETKKKIIRLMGGGGMRIYSLEETILCSKGLANNKPFSQA